MKVLLRYSFLLLALILSISSSAQLTRDLYKLYNPAYFNKGSIDTSTFEPWRLQSMNKPSYSVEVGSSYSSFGGGLSSTYISPTVSFMATEKLYIVAGGKFSYANMGMGSMPMLGSNQSGLPEQQMTGNPTEAFAYGMYQVNEKLSFYGLGSFGKNQLYISPFQSGIRTSDYQHLSFGMDYRISEKVSIGASFGVTNGPAWGISPFGGYGHQRMNPFFP
jgi:hypothetical protein